MPTALRLETTVLPGHRLEISAPELPEGATVEVIVVLPAPSPKRQSMLEFLATLPPGPLLFKTPEEVNQYLQEERDSWAHGRGQGTSYNKDGPATDWRNQP